MVETYCEDEINSVHFLADTFKSSLSVFYSSLLTCVYLKV